MRKPWNVNGRASKHDEKRATATADAMAEYLAKGGTITVGEPITSANAKPRPQLTRWWRVQ